MKANEPLHRVLPQGYDQRRRIAKTNFATVIIYPERLVNRCQTTSKETVGGKDGLWPFGPTETDEKLRKAPAMLANALCPFAAIRVHMKLPSLRRYVAGLRAQPERP